MTSSSTTDGPAGHASPQMDGQSAPPAKASRRVTDAPVRAFHALFALSFAGAWLTAESERWRGLHETLGYAFGGLLLLRVAYGLLGPRTARLSLHGRRVLSLWAWCRTAWSGAPDWSLAANLAMGLAMLLLLVVSAPLVVSGLAIEMDVLSGGEAMEEIHEAMANGIMALVLLHLGLLSLLSLMRRRNLAMPMLTGRTAGHGPDLVKADRGWLGIVLVASYLAFVGWQAWPSLPAGLVAGRDEVRMQRDGQAGAPRHGDDDDADEEERREDTA